MGHVAFDAFVPRKMILGLDLAQANRPGWVGQVAPQAMLIGQFDRYDVRIANVRTVRSMT